MAAHAAIKAASERARSDKVLGSSLQCSVVLVLRPAAATSSASSPDAGAVLRRYADELDGLFVVSSVEVDVQPPSDAAWSYDQEIILGDEASGKSVLGTAYVLPPRQAKCPRCWRYVAPAEDVLCGRCEDLVKTRWPNKFEA